MSAPGHARARARVEGVVQGVGFRPFAHRLASEDALSGWVYNDRRGVLLEVEGAPGAVERFLSRLTEEAPPLAVIDGVRSERVPPTGEQGFHILQSEAAQGASTLVSADVAPCSECLTELFDPADRRYRYPFLNCTDCGPRFTIVRGLPYDRALTTMSAFAMCGACRAEYGDPASRRFHAQPNGCPECGPTARLLDREGRRVGGEDPVRSAAAALLAGAILAVKGVGGYHLACRADDEQAVAELRRRKRREQKPFALMVSDLDAARSLVRLTEREQALLSDRARPIVLAPRCSRAPVAESVAPGLAELGVMLPSTPLHHLLLGDAGLALVMTSGNTSDEPTVYRDEDAARRLSTIADLSLVHDRPIHVQADDSVVRALERISTGPMILRRARGYAPSSLELPLPAPALLACGAELKSTFCVARGERAWVGPHLGDLNNWESLRAFREGISHFEALFDVTPEAIAHDLHPDYRSSAYAVEREGEGVQLLAVQHHHAHFAACLAEHGEHGAAVGAIYDGSGLGSDGTIWGGELLAGDLEQVSRVGHLLPVRMPGGDAAAREPWRMARAWLLAAGVERPPQELARRVEHARWEQVGELVRTGIGSPITTSIGRLFDAVAALCGVRMTVREEGRAAIELEALAASDEGECYPLALIDRDVLELDPREAVQAVVFDLAAGTPVATVSARFHNGLAGATADALCRLARRHGTRTVVLSGGVFQNRLLLERCVAALERSGLRVLIPQRLPANDGGISYGQAAVAAARLAASRLG